MPTITYIGPHDAVDLPQLGVVGLAQGGCFEATDEAAALLLEQPDNWMTVEGLSSLAVEDEEL